MHANDGSSYNVVTGNTIRTFGSECFEVKENANHNTFAGNDCSGNREDTSFTGSQVEVRGYANTVRDNVIHDSVGYGVKLAADSTSYTQGANVITGNSFAGITGADIYNKQTGAQGTVCGNTRTGGSITVYGTSVGSPAAAC
jgi:hypothetical protein